MSGGRFDYKQWHIKEIADHIQYELDIQGKEIPEEYQWGGQTHHTTHREDVQEVMKTAVKKLREAYIYAQRVDWYLSGDNGEDTLMSQLKEELDNLNKQ